jgi:hypothetical protein
MWSIRKRGTRKAGTRISGIRRARPICLECHRRPALAPIRGSWRVVKHHDVCRQCWRGFMDAGRAARLAAREAQARAATRRSHWRRAS